MKRINTLADALETGRVTIDADGIEVELTANPEDYSAAIAALNAAAQ